MGRARFDLILGEAVDVLGCAANDAEFFVEAGDLKDRAEVIGGDGHVEAEEEDRAAFGAGESVGAAPGVLPALFEADDGDGGVHLLAEDLEQVGDVVLGIGIVVDEDVFDFVLAAELLGGELEAVEAIAGQQPSVAGWNDD